MLEAAIAAETVWSRMHVRERGRKRVPEREGEKKREDQRKIESKRVRYRGREGESYEIYMDDYIVINH